MKKAKRILWITFFSSLILVFGIIGATAMGLFGKLPSLKDLENPSTFTPSEVFAEDGSLMGKFYQDGGNRTYVNYKDISKNIVYALLATEDKRFYNHSGIDAKSIARAAGTLGKQGGGSTITQQLAKNLLQQGTSNKFNRVIEKLKEWIVATRLEKNFTKEEIITLFLNQLEYSDNVFGIRNASKTFFQKEPDRVTVEEAAVLVGMINNPTVFNPRRNPKATIDRRNLVIDRMAENFEVASLIGAKVVSPTEANNLKAKAIELHYKKEVRSVGIAPYFRDVLRVTTAEKLKAIKKPDGREYDIYKDGLKIYTTINPKMQIYAEEAVAEHLSSYQRNFSANRSLFESQWKKNQNTMDKAIKQSERYKTMKEAGATEKQITQSFNTKVKMKVFSWNAQREKDTTITPIDSIKYHRQMLQTAFMVMEPTTGEVKAWVGGINYKKFQLDHVTASRQVGSSIKPMLYGLNVSEGNLDANSVVGNGPQFFSGYGYYPNQGNKGQTTLATGLAYSYNGVAAYLLKNIGIKRFKAFLVECGITAKLNEYPSICLGADEIPMIQLLRAYTMFPGNGTNTEPYYITKIEDRNGNLVKSFLPEHKEVMNHASAYKMTKIMEGPVTKGTAKGLKQGLGIKAMGGKTGTTNDNSDLWFVGYTPQLLAGVWVGCDDRFIRSNDGGAYQGGKAAAPIWKYFFRRVLNDKSLKIRKDTVFTKPPKVDNSATMDYQRLIDAMPEDNEEMYNEQTSTRRGGGNVDLSGEEYNNLDENGKELGGESNQYTEEGDEKPIPPSKPDSSSKKQPANTPKDAPKVVPPKKDVPKKPDVPKPANGNDYKK
jgi:penicillin-binding protein 1A